MRGHVDAGFADALVDSGVMGVVKIQENGW